MELSACLSSDPSPIELERATSRVVSSRDIIKSTSEFGAGIGGLREPSGDFPALIRASFNKVTSPVNVGETAEVSPKLGRRQRRYGDCQLEPQHLRCPNKRWLVHSSSGKGMRDRRICSFVGHSQPLLLNARALTG